MVDGAGGNGGLKGQTPSDSKDMILLRAVGLAAAPLLLAFVFGIAAFFIALAPCLAGAAYYGAKTGWRYFREACIAGMIVGPVGSWWFLPGMPWQGFVGLCVVSGFSYAALHYAPTIASNAAKAAPSEPARARKSTAQTGKAAGAPPVSATVTERQTAQGIEYRVTWTDFTRLRLWDQGNMLFVLPVLTLVSAFVTVSLYPGTRVVAEALTWLFAIAAAGAWVFKFYHERRRRSVRSIVLSPDGSFSLENPPAEDANYETDGPSFRLQDGLRRLTSIEYTKTADWSWITNECVRSPDHWYDVHLFLGEEWRITISRNLGSRSHAHQIAGCLNALKARIAAAQPRHPRAARIID